MSLFVMFIAFSLLTLFYCAVTLLHTVWLYVRLRAKDKEAAELRAALRLFEDVRQQVGYLAAAYNDLAAYNSNLTSAHQVLMEHARSLCSQTERVLSMAEQDGEAAPPKPQLTAFRPTLAPESLN